MEPRLLSGLTGSPLLRGGGTAGASGLLLDNISNAANVTGVWALRKLKSAYGGSCIRIRRSSDNAEQDFGFVADVVDTAGIASFVGGGSGYVVTWYDQSGSGVDVTQSTAGSQPLFVASGLGSKPSVQFDGINDDLRSSSIASSVLFNTDESTIFQVIRQDGTSALNNSFSFSPGFTTPNILIYATYDDVIYFDFGNDGGTGRINSAQPTGWDDSNRVLECYRTTGNFQEILYDGNSLVSSSGKTATVSTTGILCIGSFRLSTPLKGYISETIVSKTDIGSTDRTTIRAGQGSYFGITVV